MGSAIGAAATTTAAADEREDENEHGGDVLDEPHDCREDDEYELGWTEHIDQRLAGKVEPNTWNHPEGEPMLGWCENHGKGVMIAEPADDREGDDERGLDDGGHDGIGTIMGGQGL